MFPLIMKNHMENEREHEMNTGVWKLGVYRGYLWSAGNERMEKRIEATIRFRDILGWEGMEEKWP